MTEPRLLYQFPVSHFCEKTRWTLDAKKLTYQVKNQLPGLHAPTNLRRSGARTVPVLRDGARVIGDSTAIALHLEESYPEHPLLPSDPSDRERALALDGYFNRAFGREVRRLCYGEALRHPKETRRLFFRGYAPPASTLGPLFMGAVFERQIKKMYRIDEAGMRESERVITEAATKLAEAVSESTSGYLVADRLTLADIAAASLFAPLLGPPDTPWEELAPCLTALHEHRKRARDSAAGSWALSLYAKERARPTQLPGR